MYLIVETVSTVSLMGNKTSTLTTCIAYILKVLANAIKQEKDIKGIVWKDKIKHINIHR